MSRIHDLYSKRVKTNNQPISYEPLSSGLKIQLWHIFTDFFSSISSPYPSLAEGFSNEYRELWKKLAKILCWEHKLEKLPDNTVYGRSDFSNIEHYFKSLNEIEKELDIVEIICKTINHIGPSFKTEIHTEYLRLDALSDINTRFQESGSGYRFINDEIVKVPSEFTYSQAIQPSLVLMNDAAFKNPQDEFLSAFEHYKLRNYEESLTDCLKSIESTIKIICKQKNWPYNETDTIRPLIKVILEKGLVPNYSESFLNGIKNVLEGTVPTLRNKMGGHGKGDIDRRVDEASMSFAINMTGSIILYLIQKHKGL